MNSRNKCLEFRNVTNNVELRSFVIILAVFKCIPEYYLEVVASTVSVPSHLTINECNLGLSTSYSQSTWYRLEFFLAMDSFQIRAGHTARKSIVSPVGRGIPENTTCKQLAVFTTRFLFDRVQALYLVYFAFFIYNVEGHTSSWKIEEL